MPKNTAGLSNAIEDSHLSGRVDYQHLRPETPRLAKEKKSSTITGNQQQTRWKSQLAVLNSRTPLRPGRSASDMRQPIQT